MSGGLGGENEPRRPVAVYAAEVVAAVGETFEELGLDTRSFREAMLDATMVSRACGRAEAEVVFNRLTAFLAGHSKELQ